MIRGLFIFLVFICKPSVWELTKRRHPKLVRLLCKPFRYQHCESESTPAGTGATETANRVVRRHMTVTNGNGKMLTHHLSVQSDENRIERAEFRETQV